MHQDGRNPPDEHRSEAGGTVSRPSPPDGKEVGPPGVRLRREFKGLTVRDLLADAGLDDRLPGAVRSALQHIERGDLAAAERCLPGHFAPVLAGPGQQQVRSRRRLARWIAFAALAAAIATATIKLL